MADGNYRQKLQFSDHVGDQKGNVFYEITRFQIFCDKIELMNVIFRKMSQKRLIP